GASPGGAAGSGAPGGHRPVGVGRLPGGPAPRQGPVSGPDHRGRTAPGRCRGNRYRGGAIGTLRAAALLPDTLLHGFADPATKTLGYRVTEEIIPPGL